MCSDYYEKDMDSLLNCNPWYESNFPKHVLNAKILQQLRSRTVNQLIDNRDLPY